MDTHVTPDDSVGSIAARFPGAHQIFMRYHIDFCCGGSRSLKEATGEVDANAVAILDEIQNNTITDSVEKNWIGRPVNELITHIIERYHFPLRYTLSRIDTLSEKVLKAHFTEHGDTLKELRQIMLEFSANLLSHMQKEENVLFPWIIGGRAASPAAPIRAMEQEHEDAAQSLARIRNITDDFMLPHDACEAFSALYRELELLDRELRVHIHLENNILFPAALSV